MSSKALVLINAGAGAEQYVLGEIKSIPNVTEAYVVYGIYDLVVKVEGKSLDEVKNTVTHRLRTLGRVRSTLTMLVAE